MNRHALHSLTLNIGHAFDHFFILIFPTAVLALQNEWNTSYGELLKYGSAGALAFGLGSLPAGWLGDRWSKNTMMKLFFFGMGLSAILTALAQNPLQLAVGVACIGLFASIYHPIGTALVFSTSDKPGRALGINGVAGNLGLAAAAVVTAFLSAQLGWQYAFILPGILCMMTGVVYHWTTQGLILNKTSAKKAGSESLDKKSMIRLFLCIAVIASLGGLVFQTMTTALPKILDLHTGSGLARVGGLATMMFALAAVAQLAVGELLDRFSARVLLMSICGVQVSTLILASFITEAALIPVLTLLLFATFGQIPINDWLIGHYAHDEWRSRFYALKYTLALGMTVIAYWLIATVYDKTQSFSLLYIFLAAIMCLSTLAAFIIPKSTR
jgi:MFS family permease